MSAEANTVLYVVVGFPAGIVVLHVLAGIVNGQQAKLQKRILTGVALLNGLVLEIGLSPMGDAASELVSLSPWVPVEYSSFVSILVMFGTFFELLFGLDRIWEGSGWIGIFAFVMAFTGGMLMPYQDTTVAGCLLVVFAVPLLELAPANQWKRGR